MGARLPSPPGDDNTGGPVRRERLFHLTLRTLVEGLDAAGQRFLEKTEINSLSSRMACFSLRARVLIGTRIKLNVTVPHSLLLGGPLNFFLRGRVVRVQAQSGFKTQAITLHLDQQFRFLPPKAPLD